MSVYQSKTEIDAHTSASADYQTALVQKAAAESAAQATYQQQMADYQATHDRWVADPTDDLGNPEPEPQPPPAPAPLPEPQIPPAPFDFSAREAVDNEVIPGEYGEILVIAPRTVLRGRSGHEFAIDSEALARDYVEVVGA